MSSSNACKALLFSFPLRFCPDMACRVDWALKSNYLHSDFVFMIFDYFFLFLFAASVWFCIYALKFNNDHCVSSFFLKFFILP